VQHELDVTVTRAWNGHRLRFRVDKVSAIAEAAAADGNAAAAHTHMPAATSASTKRKRKQKLDVSVQLDLQNLPDTWGELRRRLGEKFYHRCTLLAASDDAAAADGQPLLKGYLPHSANEGLSLEVLLSSGALVMRIDAEDAAMLDAVEEALAAGGVLLQVHAPEAGMASGRTAFGEPVTQTPACILIELALRPGRAGAPAASATAALEAPPPPPPAARQLAAPAPNLSAGAAAYHAAAVGASQHTAAALPQAPAWAAAPKAPQQLRWATHLMCVVTCGMTAVYCAKSCGLLEKIAGSS